MDETRFQVFVSSTFKDLKDEREKVLQAILLLRAFPAGMELFPAADDEQFEFIKREIDSSDYYILIIGGKYGSMDSEGRSFTEKEYDYAQSINKPILTFLYRDLGKLIGERLESSDELKAKLEAFRNKVSKTRLVRFYSNPDELKSEVLHSLPLQFNQTPMRGWVRAGQQSLGQLEELNSLQREVLRLKSENERLAAIEAKPEFLLANGTDIVEWDLDFNQFSFENKWPTERQYHFKSTWDDLLEAIFSLGSSQATEDQVKRRLAKFILDSCSASVGSDEWRAAAEGVIEKWPNLPPLQPVNKVFGDVLRQFNGLGLITEHKEAVYVPIQYSQGTQAMTVDIWRLTPKGQLRLTLSQGYRRTS